MSNEVWTLGQLTDPAFRQSLEPLACDMHGLVDMQFTDGTIRVSKRWGFFNLYWLTIPAAFGIPLRKDHFIKRIPFEAGGMTNAWNRYYDEIMDADPRNAKKLKAEIWKTMQALYELGSTWLLPYVRTMDILDMAEIMTDKPVADLLETKEKIVPAMGSRGIENYIEEHRKALMDLFGTKGALKNEALYNYQKIGMLNKFQVPQTMYAFGVRTDINDFIVGMPVVGSALDGLRNIKEYAVESLSAKKSLAYNHIAVKDSQYFGRKQHLAAATIKKIYPGDCGSKLLIPFKVTDKNYSNLVGKYIYRGSKRIVLTDKNVKEYIGETVMMRSPLTCKHRDGVCEACGGLILRNINRKINLGILSAIHMIEPTTQKILSAKHLIKTSSLVYELPAEAAKVMTITSLSEIAFRPSITPKLKKLKMGVAIEDFRDYHDVVYLRKEIKAERYSQLHFFKLSDGKKINTYILDTGDAEQQLPFISKEMLLYIRDHYKETCVEDGCIWIPLAGTEKLPIFKTSIVNDNMLMFVKQVSRYLSKDIKDKTSCAEALQDFSDLIHAKVSCNIAHLEILLKAYEITSDTDYRVPTVTDPDHVKFQNNPSILTNRYIGTCLAFQGLERYMSTPSTYLVPKSKSPFDLMVGYTDY